LTDLNDLKVFEKVAALESFSAAGRALGIPKSTVSRCVVRLETQLGTRLVQRTTHSVRLTQSGLALKERCTEILTRVNEAIDYVGSLSAGPKGLLKISAGIGFGYFVLAEILPSFLERYPGVDVSLDLTSRSVDLVAEGIDVTIRMGHMPDSRLIATGLGAMQRYLCAAPSYLERRGLPQTMEELKDHTTIEMPGINGMPRTWTFHKNERDKFKFEVPPRLLVNDPGVIYRLAVNGAGIACISGYLSGPEIVAGRLVRLFPEWALPPVEINAVYPSNRELSPTVRAFVEHIKQVATSGQLWMDDPIARRSNTPLPRRYTSKRSVRKAK
jgi:LysR family transcriptional regulator, regulator for bpeEF and oprC